MASVGSSALGSYRRRLPSKTLPEKRILEGLPRCRGCPRMRDLPKTLGFPNCPIWVICRRSGRFAWASSCMAGVCRSSCRAILLQVEHTFVDDFHHLLRDLLVF